MAKITRRKLTTRRWQLRSWIILLVMSFLFLISIVVMWQGSAIFGESSRKNTSLLVAEEYPRPEDVLDYPDIYIYQRQCQKENPSLASITSCYPDAPLQKPWLERNKHDQATTAFCNNILVESRKTLSWEALQQCFVGNRNSNPNDNSNNNNIPIEKYQIHVIGERNSGTKWLQQEIGKCFPRDRTGVRCHRDFLRSKHFFQPPVRGKYPTNIVIAIVRDPIDWVAAMRAKPYHMPFQMAGFDESKKNMPAIPLDWQTFVQRASPWTLPQQSAHDINVIQSGRQEQVTCVQGFAFDEVTPCIFDNTTIPRSKWRGHMPVYELHRDHSGVPFQDLLELRSEKIINFFSEIPLLMDLGGYFAVRYEDLLRNGTSIFLEELAIMMGMKTLPEFCRPQPPRPEQMGHREIPRGFQEWVEKHLVLETEQFLGYR